MSNDSEQGAMMPYNQEEWLRTREKEGKRHFKKGKGTEEKRDSKVLKNHLLILESSSRRIYGVEALIWSTE